METLNGELYQLTSSHVRAPEVAEMGRRVEVLCIDAVKLGDLMAGVGIDQAEAAGVPLAGKQSGRDRLEVLGPAAARVGCGEPAARWPARRICGRRRSGTGG